MSDAAKLPGARETAHATMLTVGTCWSFPLNEEDHSATCKATAAAIETRDAALRSAVEVDAVAVVKRLLSFTEYVCDKANDADIVEDEDIKRAGDILEATTAWLATRTGGNENG